MKEKKRLDALLVEMGLAPSRDRAQRLILEGAVLVEDEPVTHSGKQVPLNARIRLRKEDIPYVSRGGLKLERALDEFKIDVTGRIGLDVGSSTGGFTDVLLQRGAEKVFAVDAGTNQLAWKIRSDPRVVSLEKTNARYIEFGLIGTHVGVITVDVSFISLDKILPALIQFATPETDWVTLIKPQFEVGPEMVGKKGVVTDVSARESCLLRVDQFARSLGLKKLGRVESPIRGAEGNIEYLAHWRWDGSK